MTEAALEEKPRRGRPPKNVSRARARAEALRKRAGSHEALTDGAKMRLQGKAYEPEEGFRNVWVNDVKGGVQDYEALGYEPQKGPDGEVISRVVGRDPVTGEGGMRAVLMEIPEEIAKEYDEAHQKRIVDVTRQKAQKLEEGEYLPDEGQKLPLQEGGTEFDALR